MISVLIPVYNGEKYIKRCLDSVLNQTYKDLEIIIVNDGSTDNTLKICKSYKDKRIKIISHKCRKIPEVRNILLDNINGDYFYFLDVDDYIEEDTLEYLYGLCTKYDSEIATCKCIDKYNYNFEKKDKKEKIDVLSCEDMLKKVLVSKNRELNVWNKLIKTNLADEVRFEDRINDDISFTYRLILKTDKVIYSNQIKYYYFNHKNSYSHSRVDDYDTMVDVVKAYMDRYKCLKNIFPKMYENEIALLWFIPRRYLSNNKKFIKYLEKNNYRKIYNKLFSLKILFYKIGFKEKIKMILFRVSPRLHNSIMHSYIRKVVKK